MTNLNSRLSLHPRWGHSADSALSGFKDAVIQIIAPGTRNYDSDYNPWTNTGDATPEVLWQGNGQIAISRQTLNTFQPVGAVTQVRSCLFTVPLTSEDDAPDFPIAVGMWIKVLSCASDPQLARFQYTVTSGIDGGQSFQRTIQAEANMGVILDEV